MSLTSSSAIFILVEKKARKTADALKKRKKRWKKIFFVFISTFWTGATCLPYRVTRVKIQLCMYSVVSTNETYYDREGQTQFASNEIMSINEQWIEDISHNQIVNCILDFGELLNTFLMLMIIGTVVNPLITIITQKRYRKSAKDLLHLLQFILWARPKHTLANTRTLSRQVSSRDTVFSLLQRDGSHMS